MQKILAMLLGSVLMAGATTLEVLRVYQPVSFHGTDVDFDFEGQAIQARVMSRPMVLGGAMPENLVAAVGSPHRMPEMPNYRVPECNLLTLYGIEISGYMTEKGELRVSFDLKNIRVPDHVDLPIRTVLRLSIEALKKTLGDYHQVENKPLKVEVAFTGLTKKNESLRDLGGRFLIR